MNRWIGFFILSFLVVACQSPRWMYSQRSVYRLEKVGSVGVTSSPNLFNYEIEKNGEKVRINEGLMLQNFGQSPVSVDLAKVQVTGGEKQFTPNCSVADSTVKTFTLAAGEKEVILCNLDLVKEDVRNGDVKFYFKIPIGNEGVFQNYKLVRKEDF